MKILMCLVLIAVCLQCIAESDNTIAYNIVNNTPYIVDGIGRGYTGCVVKQTSAIKVLPHSTNTLMITYGTYSECLTYDSSVSDWEFEIKNDQPGNRFNLNYNPNNRTTQTCPITADGYSCFVNNNTKQAYKFLLIESTLRSPYLTQTIEANQLTINQK